MASIKSRDTSVELVLRRALWNTGLRYRTHYAVMGRPDVVFTKAMVAVFIDGDFWHGHDWKKLRPKLRNDFWLDKIQKNIARDRKVNRVLRQTGWKVVRVWEHSIRKDVKEQVRMIEGILKSRVAKEHYD